MKIWKIKFQSIQPDLLQNMRDKSANAEQFFSRVTRMLDFPFLTQSEIEQIKQSYKK